MIPFDWPTTVTALAAAYASIVATAALALEIRRWFESGPRLALRLMPEAQMFGGYDEDKNDYLCATVTNRGTMPTTITNFGLLEYRTVFHRWRGRTNKAAIVANPAGTSGRSLPYVLQPGTEWLGSAIYNDELRTWARSGKLFVAIYHSHSKRPISKKVHLPTQSPQGRDHGT